MRDVGRLRVRRPGVRRQPGVRLITHQLGLDANSKCMVA